MDHANTPLRYPGGKSKALSQICQMFPKDFSEYREPFVGGGSVFLSLKQCYPSLKCKINDLNYDVFSFWKILQQDSHKFIDAIYEIKKSNQNGKTLYQKLERSKGSGIFSRSLRFYILNRISYSGTGDSGGFSSESFEKRFTSSRIEHLKFIPPLLKDVEITNYSYEKLLSGKNDGVFIFLDPPYWSPRKSPLYGKNGDMNKFFDHKRFAKKMKKCPHKWLITCDDSPVIRDLFSFASIIPWQLKYNGMNKKSAIMGKELFIMNY
jgi:DNA adenine methylase